MHFGSDVADYCGISTELPEGIFAELDPNDQSHKFCSETKAEFNHF